MNKLLIIAGHEYSHHVRRKGFLLATFGMPILIIAIFALIVVVSIQAERVSALGYVDQAGVLSALQTEVRVSGAVGDQVPILRFAQEEAARAALESGEIDAYFLIPADYFESGAVTAYAERRVPTLGRERFETLLYHALLTRIASTDPRVARPVVRLENRTASDQPSKSPALLIFPALYGFLLLIVTFSSTSYLMMSLVEEKENRMMEVLATSVPPTKLMGGKIVGLGLLGLTQLAIWLSGVLAIVVALGALGVPLGSLPLPWGRILLMIIYFLPSYLLFAACFSAIGAAVTATQEGQQLSSIFTLLAISPSWFATILLNEPNSALSVGLSLFPFTAPLSMLLRMAVADVPTWQIVLSVGLVTASSLAMVWVAGRVLRFGMLRYGKRLRLRELRRALRGS